MQSYKTSCEVYIVLFCFALVWFGFLIGAPFLCVFNFNKCTAIQNNCVSYLAFTDCVKLLRSNRHNVQILYISFYHPYNHVVSSVYPANYLVADQSVCRRMCEPGCTKIMNMAVHSLLKNWFFSFIPFSV